MKVYVGTSLHNAARAKQVIAKFQQAGVTITYDWTTHGQLFDDTELARCGVLEVAGVKDCDVFFMIQPGRAGSHCELGIAIALNKPVVILDELNTEKKPFYYCEGVHRCKTEDEAFTTAFSILKGK